MAEFSFGSGVMFGTRTDVVNSTPQEFGTLQEVSMDFTFTTKELYGQFQFAVCVARGTAKIGGKAKTAQFSGGAFNDLFFANTQTTGQRLVAYREVGMVPAATAYTITAANSATWVEDLGVKYVLTGLPLKLVASAPTVGQYMVEDGVYTFAVADASAAVVLSYAYTKTTTGNTSVISNQLLGAAPTFSTQFALPFQNKMWTLKLNQCMSSKLTLATKLEDFTMPEFDFSAFADASNVIGTLSLAE